MAETPTTTQVYETLIQKAWNDQAFHDALRANPRATIERELSIALPEGLEVEVVEETPTKVYLVLPARPPASAERELSDEELGMVAGGGGTEVAQSGGRVGSASGPVSISGRIGLERLGGTLEWH